MSMHTPGPWKIYPEAHPRGWVVEANDGQYTVCIVRDGTGDAQNAANAGLIEAAPDLLAALIRALPTVEHMYHTNPDPDGSLWDDVVVCRAAIAKATGASA